MLSLIRHWREMSPTSESFLLARRPRGNATVTAVEAYAFVVPVDHSGVVDVVNDGDIHIVHGTVIEKPAAFPASTFVTIAEVSITVVDAAVETDLRPPITLIEEISVAAPCPVAGGPDKAFARTKRLLIYGKGRWSEGDREEHSGG